MPHIVAEVPCGNVKKKVPVVAKMMALVIAMVMIVGTMSTAVFAANGDFLSTPENTITVEDLVAGDTAEYIQLLKEDPNATTTKGWTWADGITADANGKVGGVSVLDLLPDNQITDAQAAALAQAVASGSFTGMQVSGTTATATVAKPGLFFVRVKPGTTNDYIYNPIIVSADYYEGGNTISASSTYVGGRAIAKKQPVDVTKKMNDEKQKDVGIGDVIPFTVETKVPSFTDAYTNKKFEITDTLQTGLALEGDVTVVVEGTTPTAVKDTHYTVTKNGTSGYTVSFTKAYLDAVVGNPKVTITYSAKVTSTADANVTEMDNDVKLTYTHTYGTTQDEKDIDKKTRHYTFSIDASLFGSKESGSEEITEDLIKVGVEADGVTPIYVSSTKKRVVDDGATTTAALNGAVFELEAVSGDCTTSDQFKNGTKMTITTDADGNITAKGLDAGVYKLTEKSAPAGFIIDTTPHYVEIKPYYEKDADGVDYLTKYEIKWGDSESNLQVVKSYTMTNDSISKSITKIEKTNITGSDTQIKNTRGVQLPSTGGMGTTIFYIVGAILVLGAGILLVTRRRMSAN